jgi:hypothetical protein
MAKETAQAEIAKSDTVILVTQYANRRVIEKELDKDGKYKVVYDLKFRNGRCVKSRKEFEDLKKIPAFNLLVGYGKSIGVLGDTNLQPRSATIPEVIQNVGSKQLET